MSAVGGLGAGMLVHSLHDGSVDHRLDVIPPVPGVDDPLPLGVPPDFFLREDAVKPHVRCHRLRTDPEPLCQHVSQGSLRAPRHPHYSLMPPPGTAVTLGRRRLKPHQLALPPCFRSPGVSGPAWAALRPTCRRRRVWRLTGTRPRTPPTPSDRSGITPKPQLPPTDSPTTLRTHLVHRDDVGGHKLGSVDQAVGPAYLNHVALCWGAQLHAVAVLWQCVTCMLNGATIGGGGGTGDGGLTTMSSGKRLSLKEPSSKMTS